jgi:hypothetical protein
MIPPPSQAIMQGLSQGNAQAQSILPSVYQPRGGAQPQNPWQGSLDTVADQLLSLGKSIRSQGEKFREEAEKLYKAAHDITKVNNTLTKFAQEGRDDNA